MESKFMNEEVRNIWNANAEFWDSKMGEGNDFHKMLFEPIQLKLLNIKAMSVLEKEMPHKRWRVEASLVTTLHMPRLTMWRSLTQEDWGSILLKVMFILKITKALPMPWAACRPVLSC